MPDNNQKRKIKNFNIGSNKIIKELSPYLMSGWQIVLTIVLCAALGWWLDSILNTKPVLLIVLSIFGVITALFHFIRVVISNDKNNKKDRQ